MPTAAPTRMPSKLSLGDMMKVKELGALLPLIILVIVARREILIFEFLTGGNLFYHTTELFSAHVNGINGRGSVKELGALLPLIILVIVASAVNPAFLNSNNLFDILKTTSYTTILAVPLTMLMASGRMDMSIAATTALSQNQCIYNGNGYLSGETRLCDCFKGTGNTGNRVISVIIGGTAMRGGSGTIVGSVLGCMLFAVITNALVVMGISTNWQNVVYGLILVIALLIDYFRQKSARRA